MELKRSTRVVIFCFALSCLGWIVGQNAIPHWLQVLLLVTLASGFVLSVVLSYKGK
ncbi:putative membrane protein (plasmid) [Burkholderia gladioli]|uniref:Membrane protein n=2 Tax=Burkholderia gladioli TaxID=28095 RepID=A0AAW3F4Q5_BURGA|nr:hypothetical protein [Burkholderia gladioli]AJW93721.1 putative membrane protein [Burkholderia gladioli]KGC16308.1 putative membrane protein [Burkholderia gladioli]MBW5285084.1 hypothetical protein [Burkholderia gladioli]MDR8093283.1 hypothetical protein [Burkholderia gladioli]SPU96341.1 Uncharacterised protein [Burkholderia gladioli]